MISENELKKLFDKNEKKDLSLLRDFGKSIISDLEGKTLIGELEISKEFFEILDNNIYLYSDYILESKNLEFRAILSFYLVWIGVFKYGEDDEKKYWDSFKKSFASKKIIYTNKIGEIFLQTIKDLQLETFKYIEDGHKYVMRIFLHGFMPNEYLKIFIDKFILNHSYKEIFFNSHDLLNKYKKQAEIKIPATPKPITRFLNYANPINVNLIDRFIDIRCENKSKKESNSGLPNYIIDCFYNALENRPVKEKNKIFNSRNQLPVLKLDFEKLFIFLPSQIINEYHLNSIKLRIEIKNRNETKIIEKELISYKKNNVLFTKEEDVIVPISGEYNIFINNNLVRTITIDSMGEINPILIFNSKNSKLLNIKGETNYKSSEIIVLTNRKLIHKNIEEICRSSFIHDYTISYYKIENNSELILEKNNKHINILEEILNDSSNSSFNLISNNLFSWITNLNNYPICTNSKILKIEASSKNNLTYKIKVTNLNTKSVYNGSFKEIFNFSDIEKFESGFYEIKIFQGLITKELNFIYLENIFFKRSPDICIKSICDEISFSIKNTQPLIEDKYNIKDDFYVLNKNNENKPYHKLEFFKESTNPITLLLARRDIRWGITSKNSFINWDSWIIEKEELTIKEIKELKEKRVLVELDESILENYNPDYFKIELRKNDKVLMEYKAKKYKRNNSFIFVFDLESYANQLSNLNFFEASLYFKINNNIEVELFDIILQVKIEDLSVKTISLDEKEKIEINWLNNKKTKEIEKFNFIYAPKLNTEKVFSKIIENKPPIYLDLDIVDKKEVYLGYLEVNNRYSFKKNFNDKIPCIEWIRKNNTELENIKLSSKMIGFDKEEISITWDNQEIEQYLNTFFVFYPENNIKDIRYEKLQSNKLVIDLENKASLYKGNIVLLKQNIDLDINNINFSKNIVEWYRKKLIIPFEKLEIIKNSIKEKHDFQEFYISWNENRFDPKEDLCFICFDENDTSNNLLDINYTPNSLKIKLPQISNKGFWKGYIDTINNIDNFDVKNKNIIKWERNPEKSWVKNNKLFNNIEIKNLSYENNIYKIELSWDSIDNEDNDNKFMVYFNERIKKVFYKKLPEIDPPFDLEIDFISEIDTFWNVFIQTSSNEYLNLETFNFDTNACTFWNPYKHYNRINNKSKLELTLPLNIKDILFNDEIKIELLIDKNNKLKSLNGIFHIDKYSDDKNRIYLNISTKTSKDFKDKFDKRKKYLTNLNINKIEESNEIKKTINNLEIINEKEEIKDKLVSNFPVETISLFETLKKVIQYSDSKKSESKNNYLTNLNINKIEESNEIKEIKDKVFNNFEVETIGVFESKEKAILYSDSKEIELKSNYHLSILDKNNNFILKNKFIDKLPILLSETIINIKDSYKCIISNKDSNKNYFCIWNRIGLSNITTNFLQLKEAINIEKNKDISFFKHWNNFLALVKNNNRNDELIEFLGKSLFSTLAPLSKDSKLTIKVNDDIKLNFTVLYSEISFENKSNLYKLSDKFKITLKNNNHDFRYFTSEFNNLDIEKNATHIIFEKEKFPSFKSFIKSILYLPLKKEILNISISAEIKLNENWINPPEFTFLDYLKIDSVNFIKYNNLKNSLIDKWESFKLKFLEKNNLFKNNMINILFWSRFKNKPDEDFLSGSVSLYFRLKTNGFLKFEINKELEKELNELIYLSYYFVKTYSKELLIRDLILSEIFIDWYLYKSLYNYNEG